MYLQEDARKSNCVFQTTVAFHPLHLEVSCYDLFRFCDLCMDSQQSAFAWNFSLLWGETLVKQNNLGGKKGGEEYPPPHRLDSARFSHPKGVATIEVFLFLRCFHRNSSVCLPVNFSYLTFGSC